MRTQTYSWKEALEVYGIEKDCNSIERQLNFVQRDKYLYGKLVVATSLVLTIVGTIATGGWSSIMPLNLSVLLELMATLKVAAYYSCVIVGQMFILAIAIKGSTKDIISVFGNTVASTAIITIALDILEHFLNLLSL